MTLDEIFQGYRDATAAIAPTDTLPSFARPQLYVPDRPAESVSGLLRSLGGITDALRANNNLFMSADDHFSMVSRLAEAPADPGFDVFRDYDLTGMEQFAYQFSRARSRQQADIIKEALLDEAAASRRFSELGPWAQLLAGVVASVGPADFVGLGTLARGPLAAAALFGGAIGAQSTLANSLSIVPGHIGDAVTDAAMGALFAGGLRTAQRLMGYAPTETMAWRAASDEADLSSAGWGRPLPPDRPSPIGGVAPDAPPLDPPGGGRAWIMPDGEGTIEVPADPLRRPAIIEEDRIITERGPEHALDHRTPFVIEEPVVTDGKRAWRIGDAPASVDGDPYRRPIIITETDAAGNGTARQAPSLEEVVTGRLRTDGLTEQRVRVDAEPDGPPQPEGAEPAGERIRVNGESTAGAQQATTNVWRDEDSRLASAGGLERLGLTPALRNLNSTIAAVRETTSALVDHGMYLAGNFFRLGSEQSVEAVYHAMHASKVPGAIRGFWEDFLEFAGKDSTIAGSRTLGFTVGRVRAWFEQGNSYKTYMQEVSRAILDGGTSINPAVARSAARFQEVTEGLRKEALDAGYWNFTYDVRIQEVAGRLKEAEAAAKKLHETTRDPMAATEAGPFQARRAKLEKLIDDLNEEIRLMELERDKVLSQGGPRPTGDRGYLPRYYRYDAIMRDRPRVEAIFDETIRAKNIRDPQTGELYTGKEAVDILLNIDPFTGQPRPYSPGGQSSLAHSARERGFDWIETSKLLDYIETDAEVLLRRYVRQMGIDIELTRRFGDPLMNAEIQRLVGEGASALELEDMMFMRDVLRGTHSPMDPTSILTHGTQAAKIVANTVVLGGQVITAFTDMARPIMTEGIKRTFGETFQALGGGIEALKLWRKEAEQLGGAAEIVQSIRSHALASGNGPMASTPNWLQGLERFQSGFFLMNGIAPWTEVMKTWQTIVTAGRIMDDVGKLALGHKLSDGASARLAKIGIDERNARIIHDEIVKNQVWIGSSRLPNISRWTNQEAARVFRAANWSAVSGSIVTPGAAHTARWMVEGTSWLPPHAAQLISMYHSFGMALHQKLVVSGLQQADVDALSGALSLVALGFVVDYLKEDMATVGDREPRPKTLGDRLTSAVDRSGVLGYLSNVNNAIERLSLNTVGIRPFTGQVNAGGDVGSFLGGLGPVGGWAGNLYRVVNSSPEGMNWQEAQALRRLLPLQNLFWMDRLFDGVQESAYISGPERKEIERQRAVAADAAAAKKQTIKAREDNELRAGRVLVEQGYIDRADEVYDIEGYIGRAALAWDRAGRRGSLPDFITNFEG